MSTADWTNELRSAVDLKPRRSFATEAADTLRELILLGKLAPGVPVPERDLAEAFGISRTPLKEALRILETEGLIVYSPTRRPSVADPSIDEINDWLRVQGALEALAGELVCASASDADLESIKSACDAINGLPESEKLESFRRDMAFHSAIVAAAQNKSLAETHAMYNARLWRVRFLSSQRSVGRELTMQEHRDIVAALLERNKAKARKALQKHLRTAETNILAALETERKSDTRKS